MTALLQGDICAALGIAWPSQLNDAPAPSSATDSRIPAPVSATTRPTSRDGRWERKSDDMQFTDTKAIEETDEIAGEMARRVDDHGISNLSYRCGVRRRDQEFGQMAVRGPFSENRPIDRATRSTSNISRVIYCDIRQITRLFVLFSLLTECGGSNFLIDRASSAFSETIHLGMQTDNQRG